ncbi:hypothetical protein KI387_022764, partial [Taxus chinensis]
EVIEDPELILYLFTCAMDIQDKYEFSSYPPVSTQMPHSEVEINDESNVSHGEDVNEHRPENKSNLEYTRNLNEKNPWGSNDMFDGESTIWINMEGNWHYETNFKEHEGSGISKQGLEHQEAHMDSLLQ